MDALSRTYEALLAGSYDCLNRIVVNAYFRMGHDAGGFRVWWRKLTGSEETLDNAHLMRMAGRFSRRLRAWAAEIPIRDCRVGEPKHEIGEEFLRSTTVQEGLFLILVSRAPAPSSESTHHTQEAGDLCQPLLVSHSRSRLGSHHHQAQWSPAIPGTGDPERARVHGSAGKKSRHLIYQGRELLHSHL
jgi:hypothetical protein